MEGVTGSSAWHFFLTLRSAGIRLADRFKIAIVVFTLLVYFLRFIVNRNIVFNIIFNFFFLNLCCELHIDNVIKAVTRKKRFFFVFVEN